MGILSNSFVNSINNSTLNAVAQSQGIAFRLLPKTSSAVSGAIGGLTSTIESGASAALSTVVGSIGSTVSPVTNTIGGYLTTGTSAVDTWVSSIGSSAASYLSAGEQSVASTFNSGSTSLASGINSLFTSSFQNTVTPGSATVQTNISDPVSTLSKSLDPKTGMYRLTPSSTRASQVSNLGTVTNADGTPILTGTTLSTLSSRYNFSSPDSIVPTLMSNSKTTGVGSVYQNLFDSYTTTTTAVSSNVNSATTLYGETASLISGSGWTSLIPADVQQLISTASSGNDTYVSYDSDGNVTSTLKSTSSTTITSLVNQLNTVSNQLGCTGSYNYVSTNAEGVAYNSSLYLSSMNGLQSIFQTLINCQRSSESGSQAILKALFGLNAGTNLGIANLTLSKILSPTTVNTATNRAAILTNNNLTASDVSTVSNMFTTLGSNPVTEYSSASATGSTPYVDLAKVNTSSTNFVDALLGTDVYTLANGGTALSISSNGTITV